MARAEGKSLPATPAPAAIAAAAPAAPYIFDAFLETGAEITFCSVSVFGMSSLDLGFGKQNIGPQFSFLQEIIHGRGGCWLENLYF